jgi:signal transduction histidine kinase
MTSSKHFQWRLRIVAFLCMIIAVIGITALYFLDRSFEKLGRLDVETDHYQSLIQQEALDSKKDFSEEEIIAESKHVVSEISQYLAKVYPNQEPSDNTLMNDPEFRRIALQFVGTPTDGVAAPDGAAGKTGYTVVYTNKAVMLSHPQQRLNGKPATDLVNDRDEQLLSWWKIFSAPFTGASNAGYYIWKEGDDSKTVKYMSCVPVPGTRLAVAATAYLPREVQHKILERCNTIVESIKSRREQLQSVRRQTRLTLMAVFSVSGATIVIAAWLIFAPMIDQIRRARQLCHLGVMTTEWEVERHEAANWIRTLDMALGGIYGQLPADVATRIQSAVAELNKIIFETMANLSHPDAALLHVEDCNLVTVCQEVCHRQKTLSPLSEIDYLPKVPATVAVQLPPHRITEILVELVRNATKILDKAPPTGPKKISLKVSIRGLLRKHAVITVRDTGPGFPAELIASGPGQTTSSTGGWGLGLAGCHAMVWAMGGDIEFGNRKRGDFYGFVELAFPLNEKGN